jgi:hypothetical protein
LKIEVRTRGFRATEALSAHVERAVSRSVSRIRSRPPAVLAYLSDLNGPRGGIDKQCRLRGRLAGGAEVLATAAGPDMYEVIGRAAGLFRRALVHRNAQRRGRSAHRGSRAGRP